MQEQIEAVSDRWTDFARLNGEQVEVDWELCSWSANYNEEYVVNCTAICYFVNANTGRPKL